MGWKTELVHVSGEDKGGVKGKKWKGRGVGSYTVPGFHMVIGVRYVGIHCRSIERQPTKRAPSMSASGSPLSRRTGK